MNIPTQRCAENHLSMSSDSREANQVQLSNLENYRYKEIYVKLDQTVDPNNLPHYIDKSHCHALAESFCNYNYSYTCSMITVYLFFTVNRDWPIYSSVVHIIHGKKMLKYGHSMVMYNIWRWGRSKQMLKNDDGAGWGADPLGMQIVLRIDGKAFSPTQAISLGIIANKSTTIVRRKAFFTDAAQCMLSYAWAFEVDYSVHLVYVHNLDIIDSMIPSNFLAANSTETCVRYIWIDTMMIKYKGVFPVLIDLRRDAPSRRTLGITPLAEVAIHITFEQDILLEIPVIDAFDNNNHKHASFHTNAFFRHARALPDELHVHRWEEGEERFRTIAMFL